MKPSSQASASARVSTGAAAVCAGVAGASTGAGAGWSAGVGIFGPVCCPQALEKKNAASAAATNERMCMPSLGDGGRGACSTPRYPIPDIIILIGESSMRGSWPLATKPAARYRNAARIRAMKSTNRPGQARQGGAARSSGAGRQTLGRLLRGLRLRNDWTLKEMSKRTGIPLSTLAKVEHDRLTLTYDKLQQLSERLKIRMSELFAEPAEGPESSVTARRSIGRLDRAVRVNTKNYDYYYLCAE